MISALLELASQKNHAIGNDPARRVDLHLAEEAIGAAIGEAQVTPDHHGEVPLSPRVKPRKGREVEEHPGGATFARDAAGQGVLRNSGNRDLAPRRPDRGDVARRERLLAARKQAPPIESQRVGESSYLSEVRACQALGLPAGHLVGPRAKKNIAAGQDHGPASAFRTPPETGAGKEGQEEWVHDEHPVP